MNRSSKIKSALHAARKYRRKAKRYDEGGEALEGELNGGATAGFEGDIGSAGGAQNSGGFDFGGSNAPEGELPAEASLAEGQLGVGGILGDVIGGGPGQGGSNVGFDLNNAGSIGSFNGDLANSNVGVQGYNGGLQAGSYGGNAGLNAGLLSELTPGAMAGINIGNPSGYGGIPGVDGPAGLGALQKGDALGAIGPNYAGNVGPDAGFGVASFAGSDQGGTSNSPGMSPGQGNSLAASAALAAAFDAGVNPAAGLGGPYGGGSGVATNQGGMSGSPAEVAVGTNVNGTNPNPGGYSGFQGFNDFTSAAPGVTAANTGAYTNAALDAFSDIATGPTPDPATTGIPSTIADPDPTPSAPSQAVQSPQAQPSSQPSLTEMEKQGVFGSGTSIGQIATATGLSPAEIIAALNNQGESGQRILAGLFNQRFARGGATKAAMATVARYAKGGKVREPYEHEFHNFASGGLIDSPVPGRTDKLPLKVKSGAYVIPASVVSGLGEGNTKAGVAALDKLFGMGPYGAKTSKIATPHVNYGHAMRPITKMRAAGGDTNNQEPVKIVAAGGEVVIPPDVVKNLGGGDMNHGHDILDELVKHVRSQTIKDMKNEKPPQRD